MTRQFGCASRSGRLILEFASVDSPDDTQRHRGTERHREISLSQRKPVAGGGNIQPHPTNPWRTSDLRSASQGAGRE